jgi:hypothetical protein
MILELICLILFCYVSYFVGVRKGYSDFLEVIKSIEGEITTKEEGEIALDILERMNDKVRKSWF